LPLSSGSKLGPYEILAPLGAGGMGEVYRARDNRLGREVALKILPAAFSGDAGRRARFEQEARAAAALNHPNIVGLFDIGSEEGGFYIVSELVSGETLEAMLERGQLPMKKLLDIAVQIADGLAAAHAARITHRDVKPANIMIGSDGRVKILDFGLAKQSAAAAFAGSDQTVTVHQTSPGMIVGTVSYMSPEQARGREVDYRSDQFSFGLILFEMVSGKRPFDRPESVQIMSAILTDDPPPLDAKVPAPLRWAIERCLAKEPADRYESTRDLFRDLRYLRDHLSEATATSAAMPAVTVATPAAAAPRRTAWRIPAAFAAGILAAVAFFAFRAGSAAPDQSSYRFTPFSFEPKGQCCQHWSPDGKSVAYSAAPGPTLQVFLRYLDSPVPVQLTHDRGNCLVRGWAADGKHILFVCDSGKANEIRSIASVGGEPDVAFTLPPGGRKAAAFSPDMRVFAMLRTGDDGRYGVWISSPPGAPIHKYSPEPFASRAAYNIPQMAFSRDGKQLLLILNDESRHEMAWLLPYPPDPSHPPQHILRTLSMAGTPTFDWMPDNRHIMISLSADSGAPQLWIADTRSEDRYALTSGTQGMVVPAVSPDGSRVIFLDDIQSRDVVSIDIANATVHRFLATERSEAMPAWAAHQPVLAYVTDRNGPSEIWLHGPGDAERPLVSASSAAQWLMGPAPSPDGGRVIYTLFDSQTGANNLWMAATAGGSPVRVTNETAAASEFPGSWSPDGAWFVYFAIHGGKSDLMKVRTSGQAAPAVLRSQIGGITPVWSPSSDWIAFGQSGEKVISPDGATTRDLGDHHVVALGFSTDGKQLYGMRPGAEKADFLAIDVATGAEKAVGSTDLENLPRSNLNPATRLSLAPDGKSFTYGTIAVKDNLWMLEGFAKRQGLLARLGFR
jgi:Tol biopolymer transport system component